MWYRYVKQLSTEVETRSVHLRLTAVLVCVCVCVLVSSCTAQIFFLPLPVFHCDIQVYQDQRFHNKMIVLFLFISSSPPLSSYHHSVASQPHPQTSCVQYSWTQLCTGRSLKIALCSQLDLALYCVVRQGKERCRPARQGTKSSLRIGYWRQPRGKEVLQEC